MFRDDECRAMILCYMMQRDNPHHHTRNPHRLGLGLETEIASLCCGGVEDRHHKETRRDRCTAVWRHKWYMYWFNL